MTNEEEVILALKELKDWEGLPYCIEEPMQNEGIAVITNEALDVAIKALEQKQNIHDTCKKCVEFSEFEQQESEDCISREAVEKITWEEPSYDDALNVLTEVRDKVRALPSVTPQHTRWIPVTERLPEDYIHVLCQFTLSGMGECYLAHGVFHVVGGLVMTCNEVIAWMPLPPSYQGEENG